MQLTLRQRRTVAGVRVSLVIVLAVLLVPVTSHASTTTLVDPHGFSMNLSAPGWVTCIVRPTNLVSQSHPSCLEPGGFVEQNAAGSLPRVNREATPLAFGRLQIGDRMVLVIVEGGSSKRRTWSADDVHDIAREWTATVTPSAPTPLAPEVTVINDLPALRWAGASTDSSRRPMGHAALYAFGSASATYYVAFITPGSAADLDLVRDAIVPTIHAPSVEEKTWGGGLSLAVGLAAALAILLTIAAFARWRPRRVRSSELWPSRDD
jgi:hypothetical protein